LPSESRDLSILFHAAGKNSCLWISEVKTCALPNTDYMLDPFRIRPLPKALGIERFGTRLWNFALLPSEDLHKFVPIFQRLVEKQRDAHIAAVFSAIKDAAVNGFIISSLIVLVFLSWRVSLRVFTWIKHGR